MKNSGLIELNKYNALITELLNKTAKHLALFLEKILPSIIEKNWWVQGVFNNLSFHQRRRVEQKNIITLTSLDLAALLRILDGNWYGISTKLNLSSEARHFAKEMQTVRNRWAHVTPDMYSIDDIYRDLDTLKRFSSIITLDEELINEICMVKNSLLSLVANRSEQEKNDYNKDDDLRLAEFNPGEIVFLKSNPSKKGVIVGVLNGVPEDRYKVFMDNETQTYYSSQLQIQGKNEDYFKIVSCEHFHSYLTALHIRYPGLSTLYSLNSARVNFIPYQFRPVLRFIRSDRPRLLIADGVGVGKTIEAGLILRELQARRDVRSILIICPRPLITERKWQNEMKRFEERFTQLDGGTLRYCINEMDLEGVWPEQHQKVIVPYSLFDETLLYGTNHDSKRKHKVGLLDLDPPPRFDLVIVDEAHHIRNQDTFSHKAVKFFCDHAEAVVFLTATPVQLGSFDLFVLLNTLRPDLIIDQKSFEHMAEPNPYINQAVSIVRAQETGWSNLAVEALDQAIATSWGNAILKNNPEFIEIRNRLIKGDIPLEERVQLITDIESLHTFSGIINRTRRRDIGEFTIRKPETVVVEFTPEQKEVHDQLLQIQAEIFSKLHGDINVKFMISTIRRQVASCLFGLVPLLEDILKRHLDELFWVEADETAEIHKLDYSNYLEERIQLLIDKARNISSYDPKLEALLKIIYKKQTLPNNKIMLFSSFRHTLYYLYQNLMNHNLRVGMIHGNTPDEERIKIRERFMRQQDQDNALDILLFSEVGCEGLDYQFCDCIVNYDLSWNPMRIEQRIGRIDRNGQKSESITIYNLITSGTIDAEIYDRCLVRIGVFNNSIGGNEEILGEISREIRDIAENFTLTEQERRLKLQQLTDNKIRYIQEQEELEQRQLEFFGIRLPNDQIKKEIEEASNFWISANSIIRLVDLYLQQACGKGQEYILGEKTLKTLRLSQVSRNTLLRDFKKLSFQNNPIYREWEKWLKGEKPHLLVTFDSECASQHPDVVFIMPVHPLVRQAAMFFNKGKRFITALKVYSDKVPSGKYQFAIYQWQYFGIREDLVLRPVASSEKVTPYLANILEFAESVQTIKLECCSKSDWDNLDIQHHKLWRDAREKHQHRTRELAEYRRESLTTSHRARISLLEEQYKQASNDKIQRMRLAQIETAEADYARRIQDIDIAMERAEITAEPVAYGILYVEKGDLNG